MMRTTREDQAFLNVTWVNGDARMGAVKTGPAMLVGRAREHNAALALMNSLTLAIVINPISSRGRRPTLQSARQRVQLRQSD